MQKKLTLKGIWKVLKTSFKGFGEDKVPKLSGSLAYYTVFSMGPLLIVLIYLSGYILGREAVEGTIYNQMNDFVGPDAALQIQEIVKNAALNDSGPMAVTIGIITLLIGATTVFAEMQDSINTIWNLKTKPKRALLIMLMNRLLSFGVVVSLGFLLLVSLGVSAIVAVLGKSLAGWLPGVGPIVLYVINFLVSFGIVTLLFAVIFKVLPDAKIQWKWVWPGAIATGILFLIGKFLISFYIGTSDIGSTYGAAGSLAIIIVWIYFSSMILYFGAEFTKAYVLQYGGEIKPNKYAVTMKKMEIETGDKSVQEATDLHPHDAAEMIKETHNKKENKHMEKQHKKPAIIKDLHPPGHEIKAPTPVRSNYSVPTQRALIKAPKKAGMLTLLVGLVLWFFNSDKKLTS